MGCAPSSDAANKPRVVISNRNPSSEGGPTRSRLEAGASGDSNTDVFEAKRWPSNQAEPSGNKLARENACGDATLTRDADEAKATRLTHKPRGQAAGKRGSRGSNANCNAFKSHAGQGDTSTVNRKRQTESSQPEPLGQKGVSTQGAGSPGQTKDRLKSRKEEKANDGASTAFSPRSLSLKPEQSETWSDSTISGSDTEQDKIAEHAPGGIVTKQDGRTQSASHPDVDDALHEIQLNMDKAEQTKSFKDRCEGCDENLRESRKLPSMSHHSTIDLGTKAVEPAFGIIQRSRSSPCGNTSADTTIQSQYPKHLTPESLQVPTITSVTNSFVSMFVPSDKQVRPNTPLPARLQKRLETTNRSSWKYGYNCEEKQMIAAAFREDEMAKRLRKAREYEQRRKQAQIRRSSNLQHALEEEILQDGDSTSKYGDQERERRDRDKL